MSEKFIEPWIGVDLDGTLALYHGWKDVSHIGKPIPMMVARVKNWLAEGKRVKIFTARAAPGPEDPAIAIPYIQEWCKEHIGRVLEVTATKDLGMVELWDDRCVQVHPNTGVPLDKSKE